MAVSVCPSPIQLKFPCWQVFVVRNIIVNINTISTLNCVPAPGPAQVSLPAASSYPEPTAAYQASYFLISCIFIQD